LDPECTWEVRETLQQLKVEGLSMVLVTHQVAFARPMAVRLVLLAEGRVVEGKSPKSSWTIPNGSGPRAFGFG
jgi:ABC-type polar amino acid transport system ATPase subunit